MTDIPTFLEELSSASPVPGGGSVAALQTAMAASLLAMVANLTIGRKRYADVQDRVNGIREEAIRLRDRALELAGEDAEAYGRVAQALARPKDTEAEREDRRRHVQTALKGAAQPPLETMRLASEVSRLAHILVEIGNRSAISDVGTAALAGRAGFHAARLNVEINMAAVDDADWLHAMQQDVDSIRSPDDLERLVVEHVEARIRGAGA